MAEATHMKLGERMLVREIDTPNLFTDQSTGQSITKAVGLEYGGIPMKDVVNVPTISGLTWQGIALELRYLNGVLEFDYESANDWKPWDLSGPKERLVEQLARKILNP